MPALISRPLVPDSLFGRAVRKAVDTAQLLVAEATLLVAEVVPINIVHGCRDPNDDKFLELALSGNADFIVTGDDHLLVLNPFRCIPIITPAGYLKR